MNLYQNQLRDKFQTFDTAYSLATCIKYLQCVAKPYKVHKVFLCDEILIFGADWNIINKISHFWGRI